MAFRERARGQKRQGESDPESDRHAVRAIELKQVCQHARCQILFGVQETPERGSRGEHRQGGEARKEQERMTLEVSPKKQYSGRRRQESHQERNDVVRFHTPPPSVPHGFPEGFSGQATTTAWRRTQRPGAQNVVRY